MTPDVPTVDQRIRAAEERAWAAQHEHREASAALAHLELERATEHAQAKLAEALAAGPMSAHLHGEIVADAARSHGTVSARSGSISDVTWRGFRTALSGLVRRTQAAEEALVDRGFAEADRLIAERDSALQSLRERIAEREALIEELETLRERHRVCVHLDTEQDLITVEPYGREGEGVRSLDLSATGGAGDAAAARRFFMQVVEFLGELGCDVHAEDLAMEREAARERLIAEEDAF